MTIRLDIGDVYNINDYDELARMFLPRGSYEIVYKQADAFEGVPEKLKKERYMYLLLSEETGNRLPWGILTGVKPSKLYTQLAENSVATAEEILKNEYLVSDEKIELLRRVCTNEQATLPEIHYGKNEEIALYIGIPFCPNKCTYCTFTSSVGSEKQMNRYLESLHKEIDFVADEMSKLGMKAESVYIGGGTPTALTHSMLDELLCRTKESFITENTEFTVEAGRPDSITYGKVQSIANAGAGRISINPQTMNDKTLGLIGRDHKAKDIYTAFENAKSVGIKIINTDIIAGLPGETEADFRNSLEEILKFEPNNLTVHTLSIKKGSALREQDLMLSYNGTGMAGEMIRIADRELSAKGMNPYYMYRQKQTVDNLENTGYAIPGTACVYNMRMMQEKQTVIALGAGAVSRKYFPDTDRIERVYNIAESTLYSERIDEMFERKKVLFTCDQAQRL